MLSILPRSAWGARPSTRPLVPLDAARLTHIVNHWPGDGRDLTAAVDTPALIRGWQRYHQVGRLWRDLGYNYVIDALGNVYEGRGWHVGGHVLTTRTDDQNARSVGIVYAIGNNDSMSPAMQDAGHYLRQWIQDRAGRELAPIGHSDWANKACPGPHVLRWTRQGMPLSGGPVSVPVPPPTPSKVGESTAAPVFPLGRCRRHNRQMWYGPRSSLDHQVSGWANTQADGTRGADGLEVWQARMAYRGWRITPDGLWGDETDRVVRAFQQEKGLAVDGAVGQDTWAAAWTAAIS